MNDKQLEYFGYALNIIRKRAEDPSRSPEAQVAYQAAIDMIYYAVTEDIEALRQFDY